MLHINAFDSGLVLHVTNISTMPKSELGKVEKPKAKQRHEYMSNFYATNDGANEANGKQPP